MFRKTSPQSSFFEVQNIGVDLLPEDDWSHAYRDEVYPLIDEDKFRPLFAEEGGAPHKSVKATVSILIFMALEKLTWRGAESQYRRCLDWQNATCTKLGEAVIDHTTLFKFYQRLEQDETALKFFQELTGTFADICGTSLKKQRTDSFFVHGWLKLLSRYGLFKETIRVFLQNLRKQKPGLYEKTAAELSRNYRENEFDLTEKDHEEAHRQIKLMAGDLYRLYQAFANHKQVQHYSSFKTLATVFKQQCEVVENGESDSPEIVIREKPAGEDIICSPHNTEARYTRKGEQKVTGHRGFVTETCDKSNQTQFITDVGLTPANSPDVEELPNLQDRLEESGLKPEEQYADAGFVNGRTILDSAEKDISLEGPSSGRSQSFESFQDPQRPLDMADFDVSIAENSGELTVNACPAKQKPLDQNRRARTGEILVHFSPEVCSNCKFKERCPVKIGRRVATLRISETSYTGAVRHHKYMSNQDYRKQCSIRAGAEATVSELVRKHGVRRARHRTQIRTKLQLIFAAIACNVKRFLAHGQNYGYSAPAAALGNLNTLLGGANRAFLFSFMVNVSHCRG